MCIVLCRIYEGDVNCVNSIQQLENLEHHLHNALETLRLHKVRQDTIRGYDYVIPHYFVYYSYSSIALVIHTLDQTVEEVGA